MLKFDTLIFSSGLAKETVPAILPFLACLMYICTSVLIPSVLSLNVICLSLLLDVHAYTHVQYAECGK